MNRLKVIVALCILSLPTLAQRSSIESLLPADTSGWHPAEAPRSFKGNELFNMIDGGAALYQEYGFDQAISGKYEDQQGRTVDVEVYAMSDVPAACGIFSITAAAGDGKLALGDDGELGEYFLVFRKGRYVVTVSGQNSEGRTMAGVKLLGRAIEAKIDSGSQTPEFIKQVTPLVDKRSRPVYLRGVIAVGNFYLFAPQNVFNVREGVTGERDSTRFFVFLYPSAGECARTFRAAGEVLRVDAKFSDFASRADHFSAVDRDRNLIQASSVGRAIVIVIGHNNSSNQAMEAEVTAVSARQ